MERKRRANKSSCGSHGDIYLTGRLLLGVDPEPVLNFERLFISAAGYRATKSWGKHQRPHHGGVGNLTVGS